MSLTGKAAIVTGSSSGVGQAVAIALAKKGCSVVINYTKSVAGAEDTLKEVIAAGGKGVIVQANVGSNEDCLKLAAECVKAFGRIDFLVNNAGTTKFNDHNNLDGINAEDFQEIYQINVIGGYQMIRAVAPEMQKHGKGSVVNVSSIAGVWGVGSSVAYAASKGALNTMTLSLARALGPEIRVNAVCPGFIQGKWLEAGMGKEKYEGTKKFIETTTPMKQAATPLEVIEPIIFFLESASLITGELLIIDSGLHLGGAPLKAR